MNIDSEYGYNLVIVVGNKFGLVNKAMSIDLHADIAVANISGLVNEH